MLDFLLSVRASCFTLPPPSLEASEDSARGFLNLFAIAPAIDPDHHLNHVREAAPFLLCHRLRALFTAGPIRTVLVSILVTAIDKPLAGCVFRMSNRHLRQIQTHRLLMQPRILSP